MKRVILFAATTGYQIRSFGEAAEAAGVRLTLATDRCDQLEDPWWDGAIPVRFHDVHRSVSALTRAFPDRPPDGIVAVGDRPALLAAHAAAAFGLPGHPVHAAETSRNKLATREALAAARQPVPRFAALPLADDPSEAASHVGYPVVVKPLALSGSRGVMRADDDAELAARWGRLRRLLASPDIQSARDAATDLALVESFVPGREFAVEGVLTAGTLRVFAIFDKPDPLDGPFFEETIYVTPSRAGREEQEAIVEAVAAACRALGLWHGPVHAECRVNAAGVYVLEVAARPIGGLCARALRLVDSGRVADERGPAPRLVSLEEALLRHALGEDVSGLAREPDASGVMMIPIPRRGVYRGADGVDSARAVPGIEDVRVTAKPDSVLVPLPEGRSYLGFIFARGTTPWAVDSALREAHARLRFRIDAEVPLVPGA